MSGLEVIGAISAVIGIIDASIKIYEGAQKDLKLCDTFQVVGRRLPIIRNTLQTCMSHLQPIRDSLPTDVCEALEKVLEACDEKAGKLRQIFEKVLPGENDAWEKRYVKVVKRFGRGNKVEELMVSITENVQLVVNHHAVNSAKPEQMAELEKIIKDMKSARSSVPEEKITGTFSSGGGPQTNNVNTGPGQQINNNAAVGTQNFHSVTLRPKADFRVRQPVGLCLGRAPHIDPKLFIGRESEMAQIREVLRPGDPSREQRRLVLGGTGGMGKTQLAITFAKGHQNDYGSIFWLNAASEATLKDSFRLVAEVIFDVQDDGVVEAEQILAQTRRWLSDRQNTRWLLIFDNYDEPDQYQVEQYYPYVSHGAIVVTTRRPDLVAGTEIRMQPLRSVEESLEILQTRSRRKNVQSDVYARQLAKRLAGLPLALATAGAYLHQSSFTFKRYLQEYEQRWNIDPRRPLQLQEYRDRTLFTTWDLSYTRLESEDVDAAKLLRLLAYFDHQRIWYELFRGGLSDQSPEWLRNVIASYIEFESVMRRLTNYCFVEVQMSRQSWGIHSCIHDWTFAALNKVVDEQQYWFVFDCVGALAKQEDYDSLGHLRLGSLAQHALQLEHVRSHQAGLIKGIKPDRLEKALIIAALLQQQVQLTVAEQMFILTLAGYEKTLGADHTSTLTTVNELGLLYTDQGKLEEAEKMSDRALAGFEKALGVDHTSTLNTVNNLGNIYLNQGKLDEAEKMYDRALAGFEKALGADHTSTLRTVNNLALLYRDQGKLDEGEKMCQRALAGYQKALGADHTSTLTTVDNLATLYLDQGKLDEAEKRYQRALAGKEKALGPDHTSTLNTVNNLGYLYFNQGKLEEAEEMYQRALAGYEKAPGADHSSTLNTVHNLGNLYGFQGKLEEAEEMYQRALAGCQKALGAHHTTVHNLGNLYVQQGKLDEAEEMYQRALAGCQKALGAHHTSTLRTVHNLGNLYVQQGKLDEAEEMYQRALAGCQKALGADHTSTLNTVNNLGNIYLNQGKLDEAEEMYDRALAGFEKALGVDHTSTLDTVRNLGNIYLNQEKWDEAEKMYDRALAGFKKAMGRV
ncbi:hypothetical protein H2202_011017 [Exophiala xenobiotica]|nr:hypothetical protein H2202_011017 [Exophiala xenobiotica]